MLHYQVASDSTGGATSNSKMSEVGHYRHDQCTLALVCAKNHINTFGSFLDIRQNAEWPHFYWTTLYLSRVNVSRANQKQMMTGTGPSVHIQCQKSSVVKIHLNVLSFLSTFKCILTTELNSATFLSQ